MKPRTCVHVSHQPSLTKGPWACHVHAMSVVLLDPWLPDGVIEALGNPQKERLKHEDTNISNWLQGKVHMLMLRLSNPVYQERDAICLVQTLKIRPAQLSCLGGSAGRAVLENRTLRVRVPPKAALLFL